MKLIKNFYIHEGWSAGCIDLWENNNKFFKTFLEYIEKYKNEILKNQGKIPLIVKYKDSTMLKFQSDKIIKNFLSIMQGLNKKHCNNGY